MASFEVRNALMILLGDNMTAFKVAIGWVDSPEKLTVFSREYGKTDMSKLPEQRAAMALTTAGKLWDECYTQADA